jgi:hypothetical protein
VDDLGFNEKLAECRVRLIRGERIQGNLGEAGNLKRTGHLRMIRKRDTPHFHIILGGNANFDVTLYVIMARSKLGSPLAEDGFVVGQRT